MEEVKEVDMEEAPPEEEGTDALKPRITENNGGVAVHGNLG